MYSVRGALTEAGADLIRTADLGRGLSLAEWRNRDSYARYDAPGHHTLSLYLEGGEGVIREDGHVSGGGPDKLCLLPAGHESRWQIRGPLHMFHLYVTPEALAYQAGARFGLDPRDIHLADLTFSSDAPMAMIVRGGALPLDWTDTADRMALTSACHLMLHRLMRHRRERPQARDVTGGLSPATRRRTIDTIETHIAEALTLDLLADQAGLSTYHFAKMFRLSFGVAPHRYVTARRIERAKLLSEQPVSRLSEVAAACGFSSQSHLTRAFKQATGVTPAAWRHARKT